MRVPADVQYELACAHTQPLWMLRRFVRQRRRLDASHIVRTESVSNDRSTDGRVERDEARSRSNPLQRIIVERVDRQRFGVVSGVAAESPSFVVPRYRLDVVLAQEPDALVRASDA